MEPSRVVEACTKVASMSGMYHLSTITGLDLGERIELLYHFWKGREFIVVRTSVPKSDPLIGSVSGPVPAAVLYEAEVKDMLGVTFEGSPFAGRKLLLPDEYPIEAPPPLRKEANPEKIRRMMGLE